MSGRSWRGHPLVERFAYYLRVVRAWLRRATRWGLAVRGVVWVTGAVGLVLPLLPLVPVPVPVLVTALPVALVPAAFPGGRWPALLEVTAVGALAVSLRVAAPERPLPWVAAVAVLLYLHHTSAALAAHLRTDAVVPVALLRHWLARTALTLALAAGVGLMVLVVPAPAWSATAHLALGAVVALLAAAALVWLARRPGTGDQDDQGLAGDHGSDGHRAEGVDVAHP